MITIWNEDPDKRDFSDCFKKIYAKRPEKWAFCHIRYLVLNTNMHLESFYKSFKYNYLDGKQVKRVDEILHRS